MRGQRTPRCRPLRRPRLLVGRGSRVPSLLKTTSRRARPAAGSSQAQVLNGLAGCGHAPSIQADVVPRAIHPVGQRGQRASECQLRSDSAASSLSSLWLPAPWPRAAQDSGHFHQQSCAPPCAQPRCGVPGAGVGPKPSRCLSARGTGLSAGVVRVMGAGGALETRAQPGP